MTTSATIPNADPQAAQHCNKLVGELQTLFGHRLISVYRYGASVFNTAWSELQESHRHINILVVVANLKPNDLIAARPVSKGWYKTAQVLPIFMSETEWLSSSDVFPLEYSDMRDQHVCLYGKDTLTQMEISPQEIRLATEFELVRKLMYLRQRLLLSDKDTKMLLSSMQYSLGDFLALFRGLLRIANPGLTPPHLDAQVIEAVTSVVPDFDPAPFQTISTSRLKKENAKATAIPAQEIIPLFTAYVHQIGLVHAYVDQFFSTQATNA